MAVKVVKFKVRHQGEYRLPGDIIDGLSKVEEARLVSEGFAEYVVPVEKKEPEDEQEPEDDKTGKKILKVQQESEELQHAVESDTSETIATEKVENLEIQFNPDEYIEAGQTGNRKKRGQK